MKRIISLLAVMAIMAAMVAASAMPAFAKVNTKSTGQESCNPFEQACESTLTQVGGSKDSEFNGKRTESFLFDLTDLSDPTFDASFSSQGGGKDTGGGNCTATVTLDPETFGFVTTFDNNGPRCETSGL